MFITATAPNPLVVDLISQSHQRAISISAGACGLGHAAAGAGGAWLLMPMVLYYLYPPEIKHTPNATGNLPKSACKKWAR
jgi:DASS family divalent anion:Na+ symporter